MTRTPSHQAVQEATALFNRVITKFNRIEKRPRDFGTGEPLTRSEIHFLAYVADKPLSTVTELAARLGVTKAAVSQIHAKLEKRGYVQRLRRIDNDKEVLLALTEKGERAKAGHDEFHRELFKQRLSNLTEQDIRSFVEILARIEAFADEYMKGS
ncbi:MAG: MarR family transcriptional regulator [Thermodesulfobacteriota bacterium]